MTMDLNQNDFSNLERGIDAAIETILVMAREAMVKINADHGPGYSGPFVGFVQALVEHRSALANKALEQALLVHPDLGEATVEVAND
jgi:hypothetical protein